MGNRWGNSGNSVRLYFWGAQKPLQVVTAAMKLKDTYSLEEKLCQHSSVQFSSVTQSCPTPCDLMNHSTPGLPVHTQSRSSVKLVSIESVMPSSHLILCCPLLLLPLIFPSIRVFSKELALHIRWPKYCSFSFSVSPSSESIRVDFL